MAESGWLTRSLEQPYPYNLDYNGKIRGENVKKSFLNILNLIEEELEHPKDILKLFLGHVFEITQRNKIEIKKLNNSDSITINEIIKFLQEQFETKYNTHGGSKLPVIAIYSIIEILIKELNRYNGCTLKALDLFHN